MLRPVIEFTTADSGDFYITNRTLDRTTSFSGLQQNETITLDNLHGFIESSTGLFRVSNFNKVFFKLAKGTNEIVCGPNASALKIKFQNAKRIGGGYY